MFGFVLNAVNPERAKLNDTALPYLESLGPVLDERVEDRAVYITSASRGLAAFEHPDKRQAKPARVETEALWAAVKKLASKARAR